MDNNPNNQNMSSLPRTLILDYRDSYTNNLLTLFVQLFSDEELARQVVIVQADSLTWSVIVEIKGNCWFIRARRC